MVQSGRTKFYRCQ